MTASQHKSQDPDDRLLVGYVRKAHGLQGELVVRLTTNREERVERGARLFAGDRALVVLKSRPQNQDFLVSFDGVRSREDADSLRGAELHAAPLLDDDELWVHELIGRTVVDQSDTVRGQVVEVEINPASDLLVLDTGHLVPVRFVVETTEDALLVDVPDGLFDLLSDS